jgi:acyl-CoA synthetase (AMP-forming)/AMP-acid ligase II
MTPGTLGELVRQRAADRSDALAYAVLDERASIRARLSYGALYAAALRLAGRLQSDVEPRARVLLAFPSGLDFVVAFMGCVLSGRIAVPVATPRRRRENERFKAITRNAQPAAVLTPAETMDLLQAELQSVSPDTRTIACDNLALAAADDVPPEDVIAPASPEDVLFLQYTSGSISAPKGVMATHANVLANSAFIDHVEANDADSVSLTWLPHFHDMGLIEGILQPLFSGVPAAAAPLAGGDQPACGDE